MMKPLNIRWSWIALLLTYFFLGIFLIYHYQHSPHVISTITDQELLEGSKVKIRYNSEEEAKQPIELENPPEDASNKTRPNIASLPELCPPGKNELCAPPFKGFPSKFRISQKYHLSACVIEKSMSTVLAAVMCYLYNTSEFLAANRTLANEDFEQRFCQKKNEAGSLRAVQALESGANWTYLAVAREPIDRFLSGFTDKCIKEQKRGPHKCYNCMGNLTCFINKQYERTLQYARGSLTAIGYEDIHFYPQSWRCGFNHHFSDYSIIHYGSSGESYEAMVNKLSTTLNQAGVEDAHVAWIASQMRDGRTGHATHRSPERQRVEAELKADPKLMTMLTRMFYYDFLLFGFPMPEIQS